MATVTVVAGRRPRTGPLLQKRAHALGESLNQAEAAAATAPCTTATTIIGGCRIQCTTRWMCGPAH
jgi:hypothetical protein